MSTFSQFDSGEGVPGGAAVDSKTPSLTPSADVVDCPSGESPAAGTETPRDFASAEFSATVAGTLEPLIEAATETAIEIAAAPTREPTGGPGPWFQDREQLALAAALSACLALLGWQYWELLTRQPSEFAIERQSDGIGYQIDINSATRVELQQLEAIGPVLAKRIVADRDQNGPFQSIDDLLRVSGIGPRTLERNRRWIQVKQMPTE